MIMISNCIFLIGLAFFIIIWLCIVGCIISDVYFNKQRNNNMANYKLLLTDKELKKHIELKLKERIELTGKNMITIHPLDLVNIQAENEGIWFIADTATEAYLQKKLRELHESIETHFKKKENANP